MNSFVVATDLWHLLRAAFVLVHRRPVSVKESSCEPPNTPVGMQRLNAKRSQPNAHIVFLKPLKGPDERTAQDFLERVAAQCCQ